MKKQVFIAWLAFVWLVPVKLLSQDRLLELSPQGMFDKVYDPFGNVYQLANLQVGKPKKYGSATVNSLSTYSCLSSGYFNLYFAAGSHFDGNSPAAIGKRDVLCQVFSDISNFILSPLAAPGNTVRVNIYCDDITSGGQTAATAGAYFVFPHFPTNPNQGILDNQIWKTIISGKEAYDNLPLSVVPNAAGFYHGFVNTSSNPVGGTFNYALNTTAIGANQVDYYSVMLHEALHALGFGTFIDGNNNGISSFGAAHNFYSRYDLFLKDAAGNALLGSASSPCINSNLTYTALPGAINPGNCANNSDITNCASAVQYSSSATGTIAVFTPSCFVTGSSLSHFEDRCSYPLSFTTACTPTPSPGFNDMYFVMSNATDLGSCYVKRYPKPEERLVLCDLGYSVAPTYSSSAPGAIISGAVNNYTYAGGLCPGSNVWGMHDGMAGSSFSLTTSTGALTIPVSTLLSNDSPSATQVSCLEMIYTNALTNAAVSLVGSNVVVTATQGSGLLVFKYLPENASGKFGNITYVFVYFLSGNCTPGTCNMVQNGGFENATGHPCAEIGTSTSSDCWEGISSSDLFTRNCTSPVGKDLGNNMFGLITPLNSWNGTPNDRIVGIHYTGTSQATISEGVFSNLNAPLIPGNTYQLSFLVCNFKGPTTNPGWYNPNSNSLVISVTSNSVFSFIPPAISYPAGLNVITEFTVPPSYTGGWTSVTNTFVFSSPGLTQDATILIGADPVKSALLGNTYGYFFIDDVSLLPLPTITFVIPPNVPLGTSTYMDLAQYASPVTGTFTGTGVTFAASKYHFNSPPALPPGIYPVAFTYSTGGCTGTLWDNITVPGINIGFNSPCNASFTLSTFGLSNMSYTWMPGGLNTPSVIVSPASATVYTLTVFDGTTTATFTQSVPGTQIPVTFTNTPASLCNGQPDLHLEDFLAPGTPANGVWAPAAGSYTAVISGSVITVVPVSTGTIPPGNYQFFYSYIPTGAVSCNVSNSFTLDIHPSSFSLIAPSISYCSNATNTVVLGMGSSAPPASPLSFTWQPGNMNSAAPTVTLSTPTVFTVSASIATCATASQTLSVTALTNCCPPLIPAYTASSASTGPLQGPKSFAGNLTIPSGNTVTLSGDLQFATATKIIVSNGAKLILSDAHLHACGFNMWTGIEVQDFGALAVVKQSKDNLVEDALVAMDVSNHSASTYTNILDVHHTTFNKNFVSIRIANYTPTLATYPFFIKNCVFTCRDLTTTATDWPQTGVVSSSSDEFADLRYVDAATTPTTGLASPYLTQSAFTVAFLKNNPTAAKFSNEAIHLENVGQTTTLSMYGIQIGDNGSPGDFNLFDAHLNFIYGLNSNITLRNNVFQNTLAGGFQPLNAWAPMMAAAVVSEVKGFSNNLLDLDAAAFDSGNRFWNCHRGIWATNVYYFSIQQGLFRSTQHTANAFNIVQGHMGILLKSNRVNYYINDNEFTNVASPVGITLAGGGQFVMPTVTYYGIYADRIRITGNSFSADPLAGQYIKRAISITAANQAPWFVPTNTTSPSVHAIAVVNNTLSNVYRGILLSSLSGIEGIVTNNTVTLTDDNVFMANQRGIELVNSTPTSTGNIGRNIIAENTVSFAAASSTANTLGSLIFCGNGPGILSPSVTCNDLSNAYQGFVFDGWNHGTIWAGNTMTVPISRGFVLDHVGVIGVQGGISTAISNMWSGSWTGSYYGTYVGNGSNANNSKMYVSSALTPPNPDGNVGVGLQYTGINSYESITGGDYDCTGIPNNRVISVPSGGDYDASEQLYIANTALYRFLHFNDSIRSNDTDMDEMYDAFSGGSIGKLMLVEENLYVGDYTAARDVLSELDEDLNTVESNYKQFYTLYANYQEDLENEEAFSAGDSIALVNLSFLCPGTDGSCIYQARSLYTIIYGEILEIADCENAGERKMQTLDKEADSFTSRGVSLFPNPATDNLTIVTQTPNSSLNISIRDLSGRTLLEKRVQCKGFIANLELNLINGAYLVTILNDRHEKITKKLLISK